MGRGSLLSLRPKRLHFDRLRTLSSQVVSVTKSYSLAFFAASVFADGASAVATACPHQQRRGHMQVISDRGEIIIQRWYPARMARLAR